MADRIRYSSFMTLLIVAAGALSVSMAAVHETQSVPQTRPAFRSGVDVVQLDVSVLDQHRQPVRGLTAADFTVLEDGQPQRIAAFNAIDVADPAPVPTPWLRDVAPDVASNTKPDGRLIVILMDDATIPFEPWMIENARTVARGIVDRLAPADVATVVFTATNTGAQDFTSDRARLLASVNSFRGGWTPCGGTLTDGWFGGSTLHALYSLMDYLSLAPQRRKAVVYIGVGFPLPPDGKAMKTEMFRRARYANVNVYPVDPAGLGMEGFIMGRELNAPCSPDGTKRSAPGAMDTARGATVANHDILEEVASNTGGIALLNNNGIAAELGRIFQENDSYYVLGYETSRTADRYRKIEVKVNRPGVQVRSRNSWKPETRQTEASPSVAAERSLGGILPVSDLPMQVSLAPFRVAGQRNAAVAIVLGISEPAPATKAVDDLQIVARAFSAQGDARGIRRQNVHVAMAAGGAGRAQFEILSRLDLPPGRYSVRVGASSGKLATSGSVYADVDVPDFANAPLTLSGVVLSSPSAPTAAPRDTLSSVVPVVPTAVRTFSAGDDVTAFVRLYEGGKAAMIPASLRARIRDGNDTVVFEAEEPLGIGRFDAARAADYHLRLPLSRAKPGPHLLTLTVTAGGATAERQLRFDVRR